MKSALIVFLVLLPLLASADMGSFDVYTLKSDKEVYYVSIYSPGMLQNNDLCYYDYNGEYMFEVKDFFRQSAHFDAYKELHRIELKYFYPSGDRGSFLYILKNEVTSIPDSLLKTFTMEAAENGNGYGWSYQEELSEKDHDWLRKTNMQYLFSTNNNAYCSYDVFAKHGSMTKQEQEDLKILLENLLATESDEAFWKEARILYRRRIILIGGCSC